MTVGFVNKIETFATLDGDGIRVAVFMQGCPLRCVFCHNPDTQKVFFPDKIKSMERTVFLPSNGNENYKFTVFNPETLVAKILRYRPYMVDGGVTFTGGEPLLQGDFLKETANLLQKNSINIALDTSCSVFNDEIKELLYLCDTVIADLKFPTDEEYKKYTGGNLKTVIDFLTYTKRLGKKLIIRTVIIPDINDSESYIDKYIDLLKENNLLSAISQYELLPFHTMGFSKYNSFGMDNKLKNVPALSSNVLNSLQKYADNSIKSFL